MKKAFLFLVAILCTSVTNAQLKGDIDEELLSEMVLAKQEEVKSAS
ncbi:MAG: hypothetical protein IPI55_02290 [Flavobacteriales bacterium]|nr:hypothetical protein [Flavobacteriales bacterium]